MRAAVAVPAACTKDLLLSSFFPFLALLLLSSFWQPFGLHLRPTGLQRPAVEAMSTTRGGHGPWGRQEASLPTALGWNGSCNVGFRTYITGGGKIILSKWNKLCKVYMRKKKVGIYTLVYNLSLLENEITLHPSESFSEASFYKMFVAKSQKPHR